MSFENTRKRSMKIFRLFLLKSMNLLLYILLSTRNKYDDKVYSGLLKKSPVREMSLRTIMHLSFAQPSWNLPYVPRTAKIKHRWPGIFGPRSCKVRSTCHVYKPHLWTRLFYHTKAACVDCGPWSSEKLVRTPSCSFAYIGFYISLT